MWAARFFDRGLDTIQNVRDYAKIFYWAVSKILSVKDILLLGKLLFIVVFVIFTDVQAIILCDDSPSVLGDCVSDF